MHEMETHNIPTQIHSKMKHENIQKKDFISFIQNQDEYKKLNKIKNVNQVSIIKIWRNHYF